MENVFETRVIPRAVLAAAIGSAAGFGFNALVTVGENNPSTVAAEYVECADILNAQPIISEEIPEQCDQVNSDQNFYNYTEDNHTYFLIPTRDMVLSQKSEEVSSATAQYNDYENFSKFMGGIIGAATFVTITSENRRKRRLRSLDSFGTVNVDNLA